MPHRLPTEGEIIAYMPVLGVEKEVDSSFAPEMPQDEVLFEYSNIAQTVSMFLTSDTLETLDSLKLDIGETLKHLEELLARESFKGHSFYDMKEHLIHQTKDEEIEKIFKENLNSVFGSTILELYYNAVRLARETELIREQLARLVYGDGEISLDMASEVDLNRTDDLYRLEEEGKYEKINYVSLSLDTQLQLLASIYVDTLVEHNEVIYDQSTVYITEEPVAKSKDGPSDIIRKYFQEHSELNMEDRAKLDMLIDSNSINKQLEKAYMEREELVRLINLSKEIDDLDILSHALEVSMEEGISAHEEVIMDLNKSIMLSAMYREDYMETLATKEEMREAYRQIG